MNKCTKGPWELDSGETDDGYPCFMVLAPMIGRDGVLFDTLNADHVLDPDERRDNMRLAHAAPELFAACECSDAFFWWQHGEKSRSDRDAILKRHGWNGNQIEWEFIAGLRRQALAKATA